MLRNRYRAVTSSNKQQPPPLMADHHQYHPYTCLLSPNNKTTPSSPTPSFLPASPRFFSPTSILDTSSNTSFSYPFALSKPRQQEEQKATGLAMIHSMLKEEDGKYSKPVNRMALFGSKLKVEIPGGDDDHQQQSSSPPKSPGDFGMKSTRKCSNNQTPPVPVRKEVFSRQLSLKEMEMSEDYTCVITHGPNPKTTHIYDDCVVECCCDDDPHPDVVELNKKKKKKKNMSDDESVEHGKEDVFIYRGEKRVV